MNDRELLRLLKQAILKDELFSVRRYGNALKTTSNVLPSMDTIIERFGSWQNLKVKLHLENVKTTNWRKWESMADEELKAYTLQLMKDNGIETLKEYTERALGDKQFPSPKTLQLRFYGTDLFFKKRSYSKGWQKYSNLDLMKNLRNEIERIGYEKFPSRRDVGKNYNSELIPAPQTLLRKFDCSWIELMHTIGYDR
jgi:hypothetical protein